MSYEERLKELNLYPLEVRRVREDVIETFKILNGFKDIYTSEYHNIWCCNEGAQGDLQKEAYERAQPSQIILLTESGRQLE